MLNFLHFLILRCANAEFCEGASVEDCSRSPGIEPLTSTIESPPIDIKTVGELVSFILNIITGIGWSIAFVFFGIGFIKYILSKGDEKSVQEAQHMITYSVIGGVSLLLLGAVRFIVENIIGQPLPEFYSPSNTSE